MTKISVQRSVRQVGSDAMYKYVHESLIRLWRESVKAFILEASKHIHIDTGMSLASMQPLAANVRLSTFLQESLAGKGFRRGAYDINGQYRPDKNRSKAEGRLAGQKAYTLEFGTPKNTQLLFRFKIAVFQWKLHEIGYSGQSGPAWQALDKGRAAFIEHFNNNFKAEVRPGTVINLLAGLRK